MSKENVWTTYDAGQLAELEQTCEAYKAFLDAGKTERECVTEAVRQAEAKGYRNLETVIAAGGTLSAGDRVYAVNKKKGIALFQLGKRPLTDGMRILGAHIDSPRIDVKQSPLYEDSEMAYLDTHYYGGIKKYQWVTIPLAVHGVVAKKDGSVVEINIGEKDTDPVFCISDLLIHLAADQMGKKGAVVVEGESLDLLIGSSPIAGKEEDSTDSDVKTGDAQTDNAQTHDADASAESSDQDQKKKAEKEAVKAAVLRLLKALYDMDEDDFISAELEIVPAGKARDCGLDRSMILAYGQDDRVCAYTSLEAMLRTETQEYTSCCLLVDKEEIGSVGATGMQSHFFENIIEELLYLTGTGNAGTNALPISLAVRRTLTNSRMLSSDVSAAFDPLYSSVFEKKNAAFFGHGLVFNKYTGARGKSASNDANAEYVAWIRRAMDDENVAWQTAELGKVDVGGGNTIAYILAGYDMDVIDSGVAVLSMHAPMEITSKADVYEARKGYEAFLKARA